MDIKQNNDKIDNVFPDAKTGEAKSSTGKRLRAGSIIIAVFLLMYIPSVVHWAGGENIKTDIVRIGHLEDSLSTEGVIIRDETLFFSDYNGKLIPDIGEGEKAPANFRIATVVKDSSLTLLDKLNEKNRKIIEEQQKKADNLNLFSDDIKKIEEMIDQKTMELAAEANENSLNSTEAIRKDINGLIEKRAAVLGSMGSSDSYIENLKKERDAIKHQLNASTESIVTKAPGIISYCIDGYEDILAPMGIKQLTPSALEEIKNARPPKSALTIDVAAGKPFAKRIGDIKYYIACVLDAKTAAEFKTGDRIDVRINDIDSIAENVQISHVSKPIEGKVVVAVEMDRFMSETVGMRRINVDLIKNSMDGLKVASGSLFNEDTDGKTADIFLVKSNYSTKRRVKIVLKGREYALVSTIDGTDKGISLYDIYVTNPKNIEEGQVIEK